ncbi:hypothetical protein H6F43_03645 [Leptolyngbya sp. FACHB-36]|uniref:hypothetical protein n=1 Tax=Leptolyngbya sp. FACHB-36 TaxID=2692808 RepID=UPI001680BC42|nr:hypothetical protein [Leptolyngbya sp. FACHB-36]MBD2019275.1 hypothetical protein [Leptolyngbya sp. FACHB-36]
MKLKPLTPRHLALTAASALLVAMVLCFKASTVRQEVAGVRMTEAGTFQMERWHIPRSDRLWYVMGALLCLGTVGTLPFVRLPSGELLVEVDTLADDMLDTIEVLTGYANAAIAHTAQAGSTLALAAGKKTAKVLYLHATPPALKDVIDEAISDQTWLTTFLKAPHNWIIGKTGGGKTILAGKILSYTIQVAQESQRPFELTICDKNYGKPNPETGEINDWFGIPSEYVLSDLSKIEQFIREQKEELDDEIAAWERYARDRQTNPNASKPEFKRRIILIEENDGTQKELQQAFERRRQAQKNSRTKPAEKDEFSFIENLCFLLKEGRGYGWKVILIGQSAAVTESGVNEALRTQLSIVMVGDNCEIIREVQKFGAGEPAALVVKAAEIRKKGKRRAIVQLEGGEPVVRVVPDMSEVARFRIRRRDPNYDWWQSVWTEENKAWLWQEAQAVAAGEAKSLLSSNRKLELKEKFGIIPDGNDPRYTRYFKDAWEKLLLQAKEGSDRKAG